MSRMIVYVVYYRFCSDRILGDFSVLSLYHKRLECKEASTIVVVSRFSTEAEYKSLSITTVVLFWIRMLLKEIQVYLAAPVL
jgi:hypothetical protein